MDCKTIVNSTSFMSELEKLFKMADRNQFRQVSLVHAKTVDKTHSSIKSAEHGIVMKLTLI